MQIQKGIVKYKDRSDIVCTYGITSDHTQYYFLDGYQLNNGNIVASKTLVEAIDPTVVASSIGVIDSYGNEIIPFENRLIKPLTDSVLLVERAVAKNPNVIEAVSLRSDPLAATRLVTTAATIKEKMNAKMNNEGRFVFNDQFSEATICDLSGKNLVDGEYFSFIGMEGNDTLYLCKNTADSPIVEFSLVSGVINEPPVVVEDNKHALDIESVVISPEVIDGAMESSTVDDSSEKTVIGSLEKNDSFEDNDVDSSQEGDMSQPDSFSDEVNDGQAMSVEDHLESDISDVAISSEADDEFLDRKVFQETQKEENSQSDNNAIFDFGDNINYNVDSNANPLKEDTKTVSSTSFDEMVSNFKKDLLNNKTDSDMFPSTDVIADKIEVYDNYLSDMVDYGEKDTIIEDVTATMTHLMDLTKSQKQKLSDYDEKFQQAQEAYKRAVERMKSQMRELDVLKTKVKNYDALVEKLERKIDELNEVIDDQNEELKVLRPQVEGKKELAKVLADAQVLLDQAA